MERAASTIVVLLSLTAIVVSLALPLLGCHFALFDNPGFVTGGGDRRVVKPGTTEDPAGGGEGSPDETPPVGPPWWMDENLWGSVGTAMAAIGAAWWYGARDRRKFHKNGT